MNWIYWELFVLLVNLYGGILVVNYLFDNFLSEFKRFVIRVYYSFLDDDIFVNIVKFYFYIYFIMYNGNFLCLIQRIEKFFDGIINGVVWYLIFGGMQDYNYYKMYGINVSSKQFVSSLF